MSSLCLSTTDAGDAAAKLPAALFAAPVLDGDAAVAPPSATARVGAWVRFAFAADLKFPAALSSGDCAVSAGAPPQPWARICFRGALELQRLGREPGAIAVVLATPGREVQVDAELDPRKNHAPGGTSFEHVLLDHLLLHLRRTLDSLPSGASVPVAELFGAPGAAMPPDTEIDVYTLDPEPWPRMGRKAGAPSTTLVHDGRYFLTRIDAPRAGTESAIRNEYWVAAGGALGVFSAARLHAYDEWTLEHPGQMGNLDAALKDAGIAAGQPSSWAQSRWAGGPVRVTLKQSIPAAAARCWWDGPSEDHPNFFKVYSCVAASVQRTLRARLAARYFQSLEHYKEHLAAASLLVYQCSRAHPGRQRTDLLYDESTVLAALVPRRTPRASVAPEFRRIEALLKTCGLPDIARKYRPARIRDAAPMVRKSPRRFARIVFSEGAFLHSLIEWGQAVVAVRESADPPSAAQELLECVGRLAHPIYRRTQQLFGSMSYPELGALILLESTRALCAHFNRACPMDVVLTVETGGHTVVFTA
jgi:hypothetical protein